MLYELIAVVRPGKASEAKDIARLTGQLILSRKGVIRNIHNWGTYLLTKPVKKHQMWHSQGQHFIIQFDCSSSTQDAVKTMLGLDPRMIRFGVTRLGDRQATLASTASINGARWTPNPGFRTDSDRIRELLP